MDFNPALPGEDVAGLIAARRAARAEQDWGRADELRERLTALGVEVHDGPSG